MVAITNIPQGQFNSGVCFCFIRIREFNINDIVIKIDVQDVAHMDKFLTEKLRVLPEVFLTTTMIITEQVKPKEE